MKATVIVVHRTTGRAYSYDKDWNILEGLIPDTGEFFFESSRCFWRPRMDHPRWTMGIRDTMFDTYWLRGASK